MPDQNYGEKRASQASQVALEFARQMGGTFVTNADRRNEYVTRSETKSKERR